MAALFVQNYRVNSGENSFRLSSKRYIAARSRVMAPNATVAAKELGIPIGTFRRRIQRVKYDLEKSRMSRTVFNADALLTLYLLAEEFARHENREIGRILASWLQKIELENGLQSLSSEFTEILRRQVS